MLIGVISDTHIPVRARSLPRPLLDGLRGVDLILHAGDIIALSVLDELARIAPVEAVYGNVDGDEVRAVLPRLRLLHVAGQRIGLVHGDGASLTTPQRARRAFVDPPPNVIVFGHSHAPCCQREDGVLMFNPGSPTDRRRERHHSYGLLRIEDGAVQGEIVLF